MTGSLSRLALPLAGAAAIFALDQITKGIVVTTLQPGETREILTGLLNVVYSQNENAALGSLSHWETPARMVFFIFLPLVLMAGMAFGLRFLKDMDRLQTLGLGLLFGGALGNLSDRITRGSVVDFIDIQWGTWHAPTFNIADASICLGILILVYELLKMPFATKRHFIPQSKA